MLGTTPTKSEQVRFDAIQERGCVPCWLEAKLQERDWIPEPCDMHHTDRQDHYSTYGNCPWHHRGVVKSGMLETTMRAIFGPSMAKEPEWYHARYGSEVDLLGFQADMLLISPEKYMRAI